MPASSNSVAQARLREALNAGGPGTKEKGPPVADGSLTVTPDTPEAIEFRSRRSVIDSLGASSSGYLEDETGPKPSELYGKFTWKIDNFSEIGKRELRSTIFEVGSYKWYILVYPQGCDVCNHLSLFLCVADYDKLLPGWSHFAQFTIAVVNKDPKKSKYSDTLHRFCKKEHDWGWKKFMELNKVLEGFTVNNTLVIKAQVQVIRDRPHMPFRCLDAQYRRELVRVYLTNVETICRKFVDEKRATLATLREDSQGFRAFLGSIDPTRRRKLAKENGEVVLKGVVKRFFNEKEVTSTLVMDALFSGCKQLEEAGKNSETKKGKKERPGAVINAGKHIFSFTGDMTALLDRAATESIPLFREDKATDSLSLRNAQDVDDYSRDYVERDERRLAELGRRAVEMFAVSHIFSELQGAYGEAESIKLQDALIKEEEEAERLEDQRQASRLAADREKKARKKERRRAKKEADDAQEAERKKDDAAEEPTESASDTSSKPRLETQTSSSRSQHQNPAAPETSRQASQTAPLPEAAVRTSAQAETTGRAAGAEGEGRSGDRTARSSAEVSDDDLSSTSRSGTDEKPTVTTKQFEDHIEYLKGELARATSQLNATRSGLATSEEALAAAHSEIGQLREELRAARAELLGRSLASREPPPEPSVQSVASSFSGLNVAEAASMVSSADAEAPSRGESLELWAGDGGRSGSLQDSADAVSTGETSNGSGAPHHSRRAAWNGGQGAAHHDPHAPATSGHLHHQHPHLLNARSKSGQLPGIRPPPPPPSDPRTGATPRGGNMARQGSVPQTKDNPRQQQQRASQQQPGWSGGNGGNGGHTPGTRAEPQSRATAKAKLALNGNAPSFVPGTTAQPPPPPPQAHAHLGNGGPPNGHHPISYRNAAAGLLASGSGEVIEQPPPPPPPPLASSSVGLAGKAPAQIATGKGGRGLGGHPPSVPATPRSADLGTPSATGGGMKNGSMEDSSFSPTTYGMPSQQSTPFTPHDGKKAEQTGPTESPGLDDFAHMGLINELLE